MNKEKMITVIVVALILLVAGIIIFYKNLSPVVETPEEVAKWIGNHSVLYVQTGCIHCTEQEELFGENVKYLTIIDCVDAEGRQECIDNQIHSTPTWIINGEKYEGVQSIEKLKELTNYK